jgi:CobQ-like glutamine amidotransferase family enzyme
MNEINLVHLYPEILNLYADRGNLLTLQYYTKKMGISLNIKNIGLNEQFPEKCDLIFIGGGQDRDQEQVSDDLMKHQDVISNLVNSEVPVLAVCGGYQLFGKSYRTSKNKTLKGIGIFDCVSVANYNKNPKRFIGDILINASNEIGQIIGFENHAASTFLGSNAKPFGFIKEGFGNNGVDKTEGSIYKNAIGTYLHGPILPRNEKLSLFIIKKALENKPKLLQKFTDYHDINVARAFKSGKKFANKKYSFMKRVK